MEYGNGLLSGHNLGRPLGDRWLWRGVGFHLYPGDCLGLVAPSGAGKTLLLRNLVLLDPLATGEVRLAGKTPIEWGLPTYRSRVMYLPQRSVAFAGTVRANLQRAFAAKIHAQQRFDPDRIQTWLHHLGRDLDFLDLEGSRLSGGEVQILALLRALQLDPQVLLLDEPTASLDAATTCQVEALIAQWLRQPNRACILTSHDPDQMDRTATRQLRLKDFT
ncbi:MAG: ATP-binding cassette domain-containing protein [Spirulina sp.]